MAITNIKQAQNAIKKWWSDKEEWDKPSKQWQGGYYPIPTQYPPMAPPSNIKKEEKPDPLNPLLELEGGEVFVIRCFKDVLAHCWLHFKEGEDWRLLDDDTLMVKSHVMVMLRLKFQKKMSDTEPLNTLPGPHIRTLSY